MTGYKRPPKHTRFKKGESGNPSGKRKGTRSRVNELERFLNTLGTIATAAPLWGLFGTVLGMVELFGAMRPTGANPAELAHGISVALYNTAMGLMVAIIALIFYRYFRARVDAIVVDMEQQAIKLVEVLHGDRK